MISTGTLLTVLITGGAVWIATMTIITTLLGQRIGDLGTVVGRMDTRFTAVEGAVRDVGDRLTSLETELGKR